MTASLSQLLSIIRPINDLKSELEKLEEWNTKLNQFLGALKEPIEKYSSLEFPQHEIRMLFKPLDLSESLQRVTTVVAEKFPESTPEQNAWDMLTELTVTFRAVETAQFQFEEARLFEKRAVILQTEFEKSRDSILKDIYDSIAGRFEELYRELHGEDEKGFKATLEHKKAGLNLTVDFYNRGAHPPHALHSEGHQDSMGLCLFLALAEYLTEGIMNVLLLDDVVMSVDTGHRKSICTILSKFFSDKQFIITTHDQAWAYQLRTARIVSNQTLKHFYQWSINTGPQMIDDQDMWTEVYDAIEKNDISEAAARLRNGLERFFEMICNALQAPVPYTSSHRWDFGVFRSAAIGKYRNLLKEAKKALQSWGKDKQDQFMAVQQLEERVSQAAIQAGEESWGINSNVHFNEWSNFSKNDFLPVVNAYKELCATFLCPSCGQPIRGIGGGLNPERIQCACDKMGWSMNKNRTVKKLAG